VPTEERIGKVVADDLTRRGHDVEMIADWSLGWVGVASREGQRLTSPRGLQTYALGQ
jgi:hypothetical protein